MSAQIPFFSACLTQISLFLHPDPPTSYIVSAGPSITNMTTISSGNVSISAPYSAATANEVAVKVGNLTDITLQSSFSARFVNLTIMGSFAADGEGGTVAEFAIV